MTIKDLLGDKYKDEMSAEEKLALLESLNLADLSSGKYVDKGKFDAKESEIANLKKTINDYKQKEFESLDDAQRRKIEQEEIASQMKTLQETVAEYKLKETILTSGYSVEECNKIIEAQKTGKDLAPIYMEITKNRIAENLKSLQAGRTKSTTPPAPGGDGGDDNNGGNDDAAVAMAKRLAQSDAVQKIDPRTANEYYIGDVKPDD